MNWLLSILAIGIYLESQFKGVESQMLSGFDVQPRDYNYHVGIFRDEKYQCAGGVVDENYIITAAHCVDHYDEASLDILIGMQYPRERRQGRKVDRIIINSLPGAEGGANDIALLELEKPLVLGEYAGVIKLPTAPTSADDEPICSMSGVEQTNELMPVNDVKLVWMKLVIISKEEGECILGRELSSVWLYAVPLDTPRINQGDSGSVLQCNGEAVGIISHGHFLNTNRTPKTVYCFGRIYNRLEFVRRRGSIFNPLHN